MSESESTTPLCPKCSTELKEDFGITDCPNCGTVCFVGMDGSVQIQGEEDNAQTESIDEATSVESIESIEALETAYGDGVEPDNSDIESFEEVEAEDLTSVEDDHVPFESEENSAPEYNEEERGETEAADFDDQIEHRAHEVGQGSDQEINHEDGLDQLAEELEVEEESSPLIEESLSAASFLDELETFAADADVKDFDSELYFDVKISGVETEAVKSNLIETVADSRLDLSEEELLESFVDDEGALYLSQIPFVRLVVIYKRILNFGLKVEWLQKEVHELESEDEPDSEYELEEA